MGEIAPAHIRGFLVGVFGACFQVGSLGMNAAMIGFAKIDGNWGWRIPLLLEALFPTIFCVTVFLLTPESPRYLIMRGKLAQAKKVIARYQTTEGTNVDHPLVQAVVAQIEESLQSDTAREKAWWDYRILYVLISG